MNNSRTIAANTALLVTTALLAACGDSSIQEVRQWMEREKALAPTTVQKISPPKQFTPFTYSGKDDVDPFSPLKMAAALAQANANSTVKPDLDRPREPLESYPLDSIKMVGILQKPGLTHALLQVDKTVFQVKVGNYVGQNLGMITRITETEVELMETVRDAAGAWTKRSAKLELQEK